MNAERFPGPPQSRTGSQTVWLSGQLKDLALVWIDGTLCSWVCFLTRGKRSVHLCDHQASIRSSQRQLHTRQGPSALKARQAVREETCFPVKFLMTKLDWTRKKQQYTFSVGLTCHVGSALAFLSQPNLQWRREPEAQRSWGQEGEECPHGSCTAGHPASNVTRSTQCCPPLLLPYKKVVSCILFPLSLFGPRVNCSCD